MTREQKIYWIIILVIWLAMFGYQLYHTLTF